MTLETPSMKTEKETSEKAFNLSAFHSAFFLSIYSYPWSMLSVTQLWLEWCSHSSKASQILHFLPINPARQDRRPLAATETEQYGLSWAPPPDPPTRLDFWHAAAFGCRPFSPPSSFWIDIRVTQYKRAATAQHLLPDTHTHSGRKDDTATAQ